MKKLGLLLVLIALCFTLASCQKRTNAAGNLEIESQKNTTFVLHYVGDKLAFGDLYITIEDEALKNVYMVLKDNRYSLQKHKIEIGGYSSSYNIITDGNKTTLNFEKNSATYSAPFELVTTDSEGYDEVSTLGIEIYIRYEDIRTQSEIPEGESRLENSSLTLKLTCKELVEFIRNKELNTK